MADAQILTDASRATGDNGEPLAGAKWYFYESGTLVPATVYSSAALDTPLTNPVIADAGGLFPNIFFDAALLYRGIQKDANDDTIRDIDPINAGDGGGGGGGGSTMAVGLFTDIPNLDVPDGVGQISTSGAIVAGIGNTQYTVGETTDPVAPETSYSTNTGNGKPAYLAAEFPTLKMVGATGNNLSTDAGPIQELLNYVPVDSVVRASQGSPGGSYKITNGAFGVNKRIQGIDFGGGRFRGDNSTGTASTFEINPVSSAAGGFYATVTGYFTGTNVVITANTSGKILFSGTGLAVAGSALLPGTVLAADVLLNATGTYAVTVNGTATAQSVGSSGAPVPILNILNEARGMYFENGEVFTNPLLAAGGYGMSWGTAPGNAVFSNIGTTVSQMSVAGKLGGFFFQGGLGRELLWFTVDRCTVGGAVAQDTSDGLQVWRSIFTESYTKKSVEGAFCTGQFYCTGALTNGIDNWRVSKDKSHHNQWEQSGTSSMTPFRAMLMYRGFSYPGIQNESIGDNFGGGLGYSVHIALYNQRGYLWEDAYINVTTLPGGSYGDGYDLYVDRDAADDAAAALPYLTPHDYKITYKGGKDTYDMILGKRIRTRGARPRQAVHEPTNNSRLVKINYNNGGMRMPHRNMWNPVSWHFPIANVNAALKTDSNLNTNATSGMELFMEESGNLLFQGGLTFTAGALGSFVTGGIAAFAIAEYYKPFKDYDAGFAIARKADLSIADKVIPLRIVQSTGMVYLMDAPAAGHDQLWFGPMSWRVITDCYPTIGP